MPSIEVDWDQVIADKVAEKVLAAIGDQLKVPESFAKWLENQHTGNDWYYTYPVGFGAHAIRCDLTGRKNALIMAFIDPYGDKMMELKLHA